MKTRIFTFTHRCIYCPKYFTSFNYATTHMDECHRRAMAARRMTYPALLRLEERFTVCLEDAPRKKGYLREQC